MGLMAAIYVVACQMSQHAPAHHGKAHHLQVRPNFAGYQTSINHSKKELGEVKQTWSKRSELPLTEVRMRNGGLQHCLLSHA